MYKFGVWGLKNANCRRFPSVVWTKRNHLLVAVVVEVDVVEVEVDVVEVEVDVLVVDVVVRAKQTDS